MKISLSILALVLSGMSAHAKPSIVGAWSISKAGQAKSDAVITFLADGTYTMAEDGKQNLDPSGSDGMERGTYKWNAATRKISVKTKVDTTGEWGLSDTTLKSAAVTASRIKFTAEDGKFKFTRVHKKSDSIVGSWYLREGKGYAVATFLSNGTYFMVQDGSASGGGKTGVERGTYKWNPTTGVFSRKVRVDTNGTWGFSDNRKRSVSITGKKLKMKVMGEGTFVLKRVGK